MPNYRCVHVPNGTYFFTMNLLNRRRCLLTERIGALGEGSPARRGRSMPAWWCCRTRVRGAPGTLIHPVPAFAEMLPPLLDCNG
jgi:hypothetical protein